MHQKQLIWTIVFPNSYKNFEEQSALKKQLEKIFKKTSLISREY